MMCFMLIVIILIVVLVLISKSSKAKGVIGEFKVKNYIGKTIDGKQYVLNNVMFKTNTKTCQIDHIVINQYGVFVIETKNYSGRIYGKDNQQEWTQVLQYGKVKNNFYNPVKQNKTHIYELEKIIGCHVPIKSVVVFVKGNIQYIEACDVYSINQIKKVINTPIASQRISLNQMVKIKNLIVDKINASNTTNKEHINNIHNMQENIENNKCPRCEAQLVKRNSKYGVFLSCSNYPRCKFKKNIK